VQLQRQTGHRVCQLQGLLQQRFLTRLALRPEQQLVGLRVRQPVCILPLFAVAGGVLPEDLQATDGGDTPAQGSHG
jgi:hypothetical protein